MKRGMDRGVFWKDDEEMTLARRSQPDREALIQAMWLLFLFAPSKPTPEPDGMYSLGEIGTDASKNWSRVTPYSPAEEISKDELQ